MNAGIKQDLNNQSIGDKTTDSINSNEWKLNFLGWKIKFFNFLNLNKIDSWCIFLILLLPDSFGSLN